MRTDEKWLDILGKLAELSASEQFCWSEPTVDWRHTTQHGSLRYSAGMMVQKNVIGQ